MKAILKIYVLLFALFANFCSLAQTVGYSALYDNSTFPKTIDLSKPVGSINGTAGTSPSGAATYTIPIQCPPGTNGMVPNISIVYNSQGGNGVLGQGWNISGLSAITRAGKDMYHDGKVTPVGFPNDDDFLLDGTRLSVVTGIHGAHLSTYRTEAESYSVTTSYGYMGDGPQYFKVVSKDGTTMEFGNSVTSKFLNEDGSRVIFWALNRVIDINGNYMDFVYDNSNREFRIFKILYTGNVITGISPYNYIEFGYGDRHDKNITFESGSLLNSSQLLDGIRIGEVSSSVITEYLFSFGLNEGKSYLKKVVQINGDGDALNDTRFKYGSTDGSFTSSSSNLSIPYSYPLSSSTTLIPDIVSGDFDGDGKSEILVNHYNFINEDYFKGIFNRDYKDFTIYKQNSSGSTSDSYTPLLGASASGIIDGKHLVSFKDQNYSKNFVVSDFDGDGKDDLFFMNSTRGSGLHPEIELNGTTIYYSRNGSLGFTFDKVDYGIPVVSHTYTPTGFDHVMPGKNKIILGDFDGDKRTDYMFFSETIELWSGTTVATDHSFISFPSKGEINKQIMNLGYPTLDDHIMSNKMMHNDLYVLDFDGDGKSNIMLVEGLKCYVYEVKKSISGYFYLELILEQGYPSKTNHEIYALGDFNGDGKDDLITKVKSSNYWEVAYSTGKDFKGYQFEFNPSYMFQEKCGIYQADRLFVGDYDGDGKSDLLHESCDCGNFRTKTNFNLYRFNGLGLDNKIKYERTLYVYYNKAMNNSVTNINPIITDVNGDGKHEISFKTEYDATMQTLYFQKDSKSHLLEKVTDGLNRTTEYLYQAITKSTGSVDFYTKGVGEIYPLNNGQYPIYVVTSMSSPNGIGGVNSINFKYENMLLNRTGKGLLGFEKINTFNVNANIRTESIYGLNRDFFQQYLKTTKTFQQSSGIQLSQTDNSYSFERIGLSFCFIQKNTSTTTQDLLKGVSSTTTNTFDANGNVTNIINTISGGGLTQTSNTSRTYIATGGSPIPNRPSQIITTSQRGTMPSVSNKSIMTYDSKGRLSSLTTQPEPYVSLLNIIIQDFQYDDFGNIKRKQSKTVGGVMPSSMWPFVEYLYDAKGRFVTEETNTLGHKKYITTHKFWGKPLSITDFNGLTTTNSYDNWGRITSTTVPTSPSTNYTINYSNGWAIDLSNPNQSYYTLIQDPSAPDVKTWYDYFERPIISKQETFGSAWTTAITTYDDKGNVSTSTNNYLPTETPLTTTNAYDAFNRLSSTSNVSGITNYAYSLGSGLSTTTITLPDGKIKKSVTDASGKLIKSSNGIAGTVHFTYDSRGNEIGTSLGTEGMGYHTLIQKEYDALGRLKKMIDQDAGTTTYNYNPFGQIVSQTDPKGKTTSFTYDIAGKIVQKSLDGYVTTYDYYGNIKNYALQKQTVTSTTDGVIEDYYDYGIGGGVTKHIKTTNGKAIEKQFSYDNYNNLLTTDYINSNFKTKNYYDANGFLQKIMTNFGGSVSEKTLYEASAMNGNGQITNFKRVDGLAASILFTQGFPINFKTIGKQDLWMSYDYRNGNLTSRSDQLPSSPLTENFTYDAIDRLIESVAGGAPGVSGPIIHAPLTISYQNAFWGSFGQINSKSDVGTYKYGGFPRNAVKSVTDPASIINHETQNIVYNPFNKAQKISEKIGSLFYEEQFIYDANESRAYSQQSQGISTPSSIVRKRWYVDDFEIDQKITSSGTDTRNLHYITSDVGLVGIVKEEGGSFNYYAAYTDHLGSIVTLTDDAGTVVARQNYDAWGRERNPDTWGYTGTYSKPDWLYRGYTGHEMLPEYGLINMNGRMYDPLNGRMLRPDNYVQAPSNSQSFNRYSYCLNNPLKYTDPSGNIFVLPYLSINKYGVDVGVSAGVGLPGILSLQGTVGYSSRSGNAYASVGVSAGGVSGNIGWGTQSGFTGSLGIGMGFGSLNTNLTSAGIGWSQNGGFYATVAGISMSTDGSVSFNPSLSYAYNTSSLRRKEESFHDRLQRLLDESPAMTCTTCGDLNNKHEFTLNSLEKKFSKVNDYYSSVSLIPGMAISFANDTKYGRWASMGGGKFSIAPYSVQKQLIQQAAWSGRYASTGSIVIGTAGAVLTLGSDVVGVYEYYRTGGMSPNSVSPAQLVVDASASYIGIYGGWPGALVSSTYFIASPIIWFKPGNTSPYVVPTNDNLRLSH